MKKKNFECDTSNVLFFPKEGIIIFTQTGREWMESVCEVQSKRM